MKTYKQALEARATKYAREAAADRKAAAKVAAFSPTDPRIGVLSRKGKPVYYAFINGIYVETTDLSALMAELAS